MSTTDIGFSPESYRSHAGQLQDLADSFMGQTMDFLDGVSDESVLGVNDKIGKHAHKIYKAAHTIGSVAAVALTIGMEWYADDLSDTADDYANVEQSASDASKLMVSTEQMGYY